MWKSWENTIADDLVLLLLDSFVHTIFKMEQIKNNRETFPSLCKALFFVIKEYL